MSSSRESSPAHESSPTSPLQLTPNSKVKALLASLDDDSDDVTISESARARLLSTIAKKPASKPTSPLKAREKSQNDIESEEESETGTDEDDEIVRPKGRIAARMHVAGDESEPEVERLAEDARERVKRRLMTKSNFPEPTINTVDFEESDENDAPIVSRKRKIRVPRRGSPTPSPQKGPASPGLFVSPAKSATPQNESSDEDLPSNPLMDDRFKALVEKKRQERHEKEAKEAAEKAKKMAEWKKQAVMLEEDDDISDDNVEQRLTQQAKPTRKASKRAKEEIARETQRLSRSMQLTHEARTKKKATKADLFKRFNYRPVGGEKEQTSELARPASSSSAPHSDVEMHETPPTSPASYESIPGKASAAIDASGTLQQGPNGSDEKDLPTLEEVINSSPPRKLDKGKERAVESPEPEVLEKKPQFKQRPIRIRPPMASERQTSVMEDSDSDLEVVAVATKIADARTKKLDSIFDRIPARQAKESHAVQALKMFAHLKSPRKQNLGRNKIPSITTTELQLSLQQRAREQAKREREEKYEALRAKGIHVQTAEEREKALAEVEDLMARARREGEEIRKKEKEAAKRERKAKEVNPLGDSSDDEDWKEETFTEQLSGSGSDDGEEDSTSDASGEEDDEEEDEMGLVNEEDADATTLNPMFDNEADETDDDEAEAELSGDEEMAEADAAVDDQEEEDLPPQITRRVRKSKVISDDEEDNDPVMETPSALRTDSPMQLHTDSPRAPNSVLRSATKTFIPGLTVAGPAGLGLTQIFAGTMDDSQTALFDEPPTVSNSLSPRMESEQDSMAFLRRIPPLDLPPFVPTMEDSQDVVIDSQSGVSHVPESQNLESQNMESQSRSIQLIFSQSQVHSFDSLVDPMATQFSDFPEATQDAGFQHMTPIRGRFVDAPPSTVDTVIIEPASVSEPLDETPIVKKKGKLRQRAQVTAFSDEEDTAELTEVEIQEEEGRPSANVFDTMRKASKKKETILDEFNKKTSKAKEMVHDQAEESEDEYAGLGGASDDESGDEADEYVKAMIDDEGGKEIDERKLAAFFADRERATDEKQVEKLYNDITKGMLRRKRGADYDLSDSDDGGEARRRMKRKEFAKMRKALLADERIGKIAENPKKEAFLRAIEDRGSEDEMDFLEDFPEQESSTDSQSQTPAGESQQRVPDSQPDIVMGPPKRKRSDDTTEPVQRAPPHLRRTNGSKKPSNLSEIRESVSSLIEEPNTMITAPDSGSDSEDELEIVGEDDSASSSERNKENRDPFALRRKAIPMVDRISLKRASSSSLSNSTRLAFAAGSSAPGFKVPPLLRRATTNNSLTSTSSTNSSVSGGMSATERMAGGLGNDAVKRGGGKNSGVHYFARESERRAAAMKTEKRREQKRFKGAEVRRKVVGGLFGGGKFE